MPIIRIYLCPSDIEFGEVIVSIQKIVASIPEFNITCENVTVLFPKDLYDSDIPSFFSDNQNPEPGSLIICEVLINNESGRTQDSFIRLNEGLYCYLAELFANKVEKIEVITQLINPKLVISRVLKS